MKISIRLTDALWQEIKKEALKDKKNESVAFITAEYYTVNDVTVMIGKSVIPATKKDDYLYRSDIHLEVSPMYVNRVLNLADDQKTTVIMIHSHPFEQHIPYYSISDDLGEKRTSETISHCLDNEPPVGSILVGQKRINCRGWSGVKKRMLKAEVTILKKKRFKYINPKIRNITNNVFNTKERQVQILGSYTQKTIETLKIGIVGLGGTGSAVAEQLVRLGVKDLILVDPDNFESSNLSRMYGSKREHREQSIFKVILVKSHLLEIEPRCKILPMSESVISKNVLERLSICNIIFSCLDRHAPRALLNEISYHCFIPIIDVGAGLDRKMNKIIGGSVRTTQIGPDLPCLFCQELIRPEIIMAENLSKEEYEQRRKEQYVVDMDLKTSSIINYTTLAATFGINLFIEMLQGSKPDTYSTLLFNIESTDIMKLTPKRKKECVCIKRLGVGTKIPFSVAD